MLEKPVYTEPWLIVFVYKTFKTKSCKLLKFKSGLCDLKII